MLAGGAEPVSGWRIGVPAIGALAGGGGAHQLPFGGGDRCGGPTSTGSGLFVALVLA